MAFVLAVILETDRGRELLRDHFEKKAKVQSKDPTLTSGEDNAHTIMTDEHEDDVGLRNVLEEEEWSGEFGKDDGGKFTTDANAACEAWASLLDGSSVLERYS